MSSNPYPHTHTHTHVHAHICAGTVQVHRELPALLQQRLLCSDAFCVLILSRQGLTYSRLALNSEFPYLHLPSAGTIGMQIMPSWGLFLLKTGLARFASNSWSPCFSLPCAGITGKGHLMVLCDCLHFSWLLAILCKFFKYHEKKLAFYYSCSEFIV